MSSNSNFARVLFRVMRSLCVEKIQKLQRVVEKYRIEGLVRSMFFQAKTKHERKDPLGVEPGCYAHGVPAKPLHQELFSDLTHAKLDTYCVFHHVALSAFAGTQHRKTRRSAACAVENWLDGPIEAVI